LGIGKRVILILTLLLQNSIFVHAIYANPELPLGMKENHILLIHPVQCFNLLPRGKLPGEQCLSQSEDGKEKEEERGRARRVDKIIKRCY
jgi:hypothetical protein